MNKRGLTLIEVIVASLILALTVGGVLFVFSTEMGVVTHTEREMQATDFARQTLEELKNAVGADTWESTDFVDGTYTQDLPASSELVTKFPHPTENSREYTVTGIDVDNDGINDYKRVDVTVNWDEPVETQ